GSAPHPAATPARLRVSCVASVGGVSVEADAYRGEDKAPDPTSCSSITDQPNLVALAADFFDSIGQLLPVHNRLGTVVLPPQTDIVANGLPPGFRANSC